MSELRKLKAIEQFGMTYVQRYLADDKGRRDAIASNPLVAFDFFCSKAFYRGRRDEISTTFKDRTLGVLQQYRTLEAIDLSGLNAQLWNAGVNNRYDRQMVVEAIGFTRKDLQPYGCNIFTWAVDAIQHGRSAEAYGNLIAIHAIGDKLSTFYLRDVALVADIEDSIPAQDYAYFQPVDTWVEQVALSLGLIERSDRGKINTVKDKLIRACLEAEISPLLFNAGAWLAGAHAYTLLLEML
jgi:hypothetical protein